MQTSRWTDIHCKNRVRINNRHAKDKVEKIPKHSMRQNISKNNLDFVLCWPSTMDMEPLLSVVCISSEAPLEKMSFSLAGNWETLENGDF